MATEQEWKSIVKMFNDSNMIILEQDRQQEIHEAICKLADFVESKIDPESVDEWEWIFIELADLIFKQKY